MRKTVFFIIILGLTSFNLSAQANKYLGVRAQFGATLPQTSAEIAIKGGMGGGIGLAYLLEINPEWRMLLDGTFSVFSLMSTERDFDAATQTWTKLGERRINFLSPEMTLTLSKSHGAKNRLRTGLGVFLSKNFQKTPPSEQANYWGNSTTIDENYALSNQFLTGFNYGMSVESGVNFNVFHFSLRYKHGLVNLNTEGVAWRQNYVQFGVTYFFGMLANTGIKHTLDDNQRYTF
jgi:hypothetical protein